MDPDGSGCFDYNEFLHHFEEGIGAATRGACEQASGPAEDKRTATELPVTESKSAGKPGINPYPGLEAAATSARPARLTLEDGAQCIRRFDEDKSAP